MSITRQILKHSAIYSGANVLGKLVSFLMLPFYAYIFRAEGYGIIAMVDASVGLLTILFGAAAHNAILATFHSKGSDERAKRHVISTSMWLSWGIALLLVVGPLFLSEWLSEVLLGSSAHSRLLVLGLVTFVVGMGNKAGEAFLVITQKSVAYSLVGILRLVFGLSMNIVFVIVLGFGVIGVFLSSLLTAVVAGLVLHGIAAKYNGCKYDAKIGKELISFWAPLIPGELAAYIGRQTERFFVRFMVSLEGVGLLEMAYKFPPLLNMFIMHPFILAWRTKSFEIAKQGGAPVVMGQMFTTFIFLMLFGAVVLAVTIQDLLVLLTPEEFWKVARIVRIEIVSTVLAAGTSFFVFGLYYGRKTGTISLIKAVTAGVKVGVSAILVSAAGLQGAAYGALIGQSIAFGWTFREAQRCYPVVLEHQKLLILVGGAVFIVAGTGLMDHTELGVIVALRETIVQPVLERAADTVLGDWKEGRVVTILATKGNAVVSLALNGIMAMTFGALIVVVKPKVVAGAWRSARKRLAVLWAK